MKRRRIPGDSEPVVYGMHAAGRFLERYPDRVVRLLTAEDRADRRLRQLRRLAEELGVTTAAAPREELDRHAAGGAHQGVVAVVRPRPPGDEGDLASLLDGLAEPPFLLILDGVQDPHNLGACLRSADATGVHAVIAPRDRAAGLTPAARKVACGASETVPFVQVTNLARTLRELAGRDIRLVGTDEAAPETVFDTDLGGRLGLVMGGEGRGLRRLTREHCHALVRLPMLGTVESLNVSVATGVCLYAALRERSGPATSPCLREGH